MLKSGFIMFGGLLVLAALTGFVDAQICVPCLAIFVGVGAGYLAGIFDKPQTQNLAVRAGFASGLMGGVGGLMGHIISGIISTASVTEEELCLAEQTTNQLLEWLNLPPTAQATTNIYSWLGALGISCCFGIFTMIIMAGLGALGGLLWWNMTGKNQGGISASPSFQ